MSWRRFLDDFGLLFFKPKAGIKKIVEGKPSLHKIVYILFFVGLLRGVLETIWLYLMKGQFQQFIFSLGSLQWYLFNGGPFIIVNITSVYFLWALTAFIIFGIVLYVVSVILFFSVYEMLPFKIGLTSHLLSGILYIIFTSVLAIILIILGYNHNRIVKTINDFMRRK